MPLKLGCHSTLQAKIWLTAAYPPAGALGSRNIEQNLFGNVPLSLSAPNALCDLSVRTMKKSTQRIMDVPLAEKFPSIDNRKILQSINLRQLSIASTVDETIVVCRQ